MTLLDRHPAQPDAARVPPTDGAATAAPSVGRGASTGSTRLDVVGSVLAERIGWTVALIAVLGAAVRLRPLAASLEVVPFLLAPATAATLVLLALVWRTAHRTADLVGWCAMALSTALFLTWTVGTWFASPGYGTDAVAFNEQAADLVLAGENPYGADLSGSLDRYGVPPTLTTLTQGGGVVDQLSYPAGAVLPLVAVRALGVSTQAANVLDVVAWVAALGLLFVLLPRPLRWLAVLLMSDNLLGGFVAGGVTDPVYLVPLLLALWRWDGFGTGRGVESWLGPVALGLACSVKQLPWFFAPFLLVGVCVQARRRGDDPWRAGARYTGTAVAVFAVVNLPFAVLDPGAWLTGTFLPLTQPLVPDGQGLVNLVVQAGVGGGYLKAVSVAGYAGFLAALALFVADHDRWRRVWPLLVLLAFLLPARSLSSYLLMALPAVLVAFASVRPVPGGAVAAVPAGLRRGASAVAAAGLVTAAVAVVLALTVPGPLRVEVLDVRGTGARQTVSEVSVRVTNTSRSTLDPSYTVSSGGQHSGWWDTTGGSRALAPGESRDLVLAAPGAVAMPGVRDRFSVTAFTSEPATVSVSPARQETTSYLSVTPSMVPGAVPVGEPVELTVQVRDALGQPVRRPGVRLALSQVSFAPDGLLPGTAAIDGQPAGRSPVRRVTGPDGSATFTVVGTAVQRDPVYLQAWIDGGPSDAQSFSGYVSLRFSAP